MATPQAVESFWMQLAESGLIPDQQVNDLARELARDGIETDVDVAQTLVKRGQLTRYQADRLLEGRSRGFFFDRYKLLDLLGVGGMGWVYRATDTETGAIVALKVLLDQLKNDHGMLARFEQEARAGLRFHHENIVQTFACGSAGGLPYMIMEFIEGVSLLELLRLQERCRLPWEHACEIATQAARALHHIHQAGFIHRDVKPQNLLIDHAGHVKLLDFGLTMLRDGEEGDEFSMAMIFGHECVGTAAFTAPEQANDSLSADARSDIYSLGCTLFAALTGDTPFPYNDPNEVLRAHQIETPRNVCEILPAIPKPVGEIVAKMLARDPDHRFSSAADVAAELAVWSRRSKFEFDFNSILAERTKNARDKLAEIHRRNRGISGAASSTARPATISSVASASNNDLPAERRGGHHLSSASSIARRNPFGIDRQPTIEVRDRGDKGSVAKSRSTNSIESEMVLIPMNGGSAITLSNDRFVIGRAADCDLRVHDAAVSGHHCELRFDGRQWSLIDLESRNGVRVNGEIVKKRLLKRGDTIVVGTSLRLSFGDLQNETVAVTPKHVQPILTGLIAMAASGALIAAALWFWLIRH